MAVATAVLVGGDGCARVREGERAEGGGSTGDSESGPGGVRGAPWRRLGAPGRSQAGREGGASTARLRAGHAAASPPGRRKKTVLPLVGRAGFAWLSCYSGGLAGLPGKFR